MCIRDSNIYNAEKYKTQEVLEELFEEAIKQEMSKRMVSNKPKDPNNPKRIIRRASDMTPEERAKLKGDTIIWPQIKNRNLKDNYADLLAQRMQDGLRNANKMCIRDRCITKQDPRPKRGTDFSLIAVVLIATTT